MRQLALVQAVVAEPFLSGAPISLARKERLAQDCGLSSEIVSSHSGVIPLHAIERFMVRLQHMMGDPAFMFAMLDEGPQRDGHAVANVALPRNVTGLDAIRCIASSYSRVLVGAGFYCEIEGSRVWLLRTAATTDWTDRWAVQQYNMGVMLRSVQRVLGLGVRPKAMRLLTPPKPHEIPDEFRGIPIERHRIAMGLAFDLADLARLDTARETDQPRKAMASVSQNDVTDFLSSLLGAASTDCLSQKAAQAFGMSERSYRRRLRDIGVTHKQLVSDARLTRALDMLADHQFSVTEIAFELGYEHPSAFTRFFVQRMGIGPAEYRRSIVD